MRVPIWLGYPVDLHGICAYTIFSCGRTYLRTKVFHEVLVDPKNIIFNFNFGRSTPPMGNVWPEKTNFQVFFRKPKMGGPLQNISCNVSIISQHHAIQRCILRCCKRRLHDFLHILQHDVSISFSSFDWLSSNGFFDAIIHSYIP